jgi:hypothetical protein
MPVWAAVCITVPAIIAQWYGLDGQVSYESESLRWNNEHESDHLACEDELGLLEPLARKLLACKVHDAERRTRGDRQIQAIDECKELVLRNVDRALQHWSIPSSKRRIEGIGDLGSTEWLGYSSLCVWRNSKFRRGEKGLYEIISIADELDAAGGWLSRWLRRGYLRLRRRIGCVCRGSVRHRG